MIASYWRALRWSTWLGWRIDSNWTAPSLFVLYVVLKPLAGSLLLVCMYWAAQRATGGKVTEGFLPFLFISSTCFMVVGGIATGMSSAVVSDRESYGMLKVVRICPIEFRGYLIGRGLSRAGQACIGALLTLIVGMLVLPELRLALSEHEVSPIWLAVFLCIGMTMQVALGLLLASAVLNMSRYGNFLSEGVAGVLFLLSGAVFPIDLLPPALRVLSLSLPTTYWLEGMRRSLLGGGSVKSMLDAWETSHLAAALLACTAVLIVIAHFFFRWSEHRAFRLGLYDENSGN
jgi:ABC-2 type transport system permease protein